MQGCRDAGMQDTGIQDTGCRDAGYRDAECRDAGVQGCSFRAAALAKSQQPCLMAKVSQVQVGLTRHSCLLVFISVD